MHSNATALGSLHIFLPTTSCGGQCVHGLGPHAYTLLKPSAAELSDAVTMSTLEAYERFGHAEAWVYIGESTTQARGTDVSLVDRIVVVTRSRLFPLQLVILGKLLRQPNQSQRSAPAC